MGAQGIKRRKKRHDLPEGPPISEGDVDRLFGRFTGNAYSPAGSLERNGFFWRQLRRNGTPATRWLARGVAAVAVVVIVLTFVRWP